jgi:hypothetical protein
MNNDQGENTAKPADIAVDLEKAEFLFGMENFDEDEEGAKLEVATGDDG